MMRRAKVDYLDKEDMMGHKVGLEKHYERYLEEDFERFPEYQKAIPFLTISEEEKTKYELEVEKQKNDLLKIKNEEVKKAIEQNSVLTKKISLVEQKLNEIIFQTKDVQSIPLKLKTQKNIREIIKESKSKIPLNKIR